MASTPVRVVTAMYVPGPQGNDTQQGHEPLGFRLPLTYVSATEQLDGLGDPDLVQVHQQRHAQQEQEQRRRPGHAVPADIEPQGTGIPSI